MPLRRTHFVFFMVFAGLAAVSYGQPCPAGVPNVACYVNPCEVATCPGVAQAVCRPDFCGGCHATWVMNGLDVTETCNKASAVVNGLAQKVETRATDPQLRKPGASPVGGQSLTTFLRNRASAVGVPVFGSKPVNAPNFNVRPAGAPVLRTRPTGAQNSDVRPPGASPYGGSDNSPDVRPAGAPVSLTQGTGAQNFNVRPAGAQSFQSSGPSALIQSSQRFRNLGGSNFGFRGFRNRGFGSPTPFGMFSLAG